MVALAGDGVFRSTSPLALYPPFFFILLMLVDADETDQELVVERKLRYPGPLGTGLLLRLVCSLAMALW